MPKTTGRGWLEYALRPRFAALGLAALAGCSAIIACHHAVQQTAYMGDGVYAGSPPLCLQQREESRPSTYYRSLLVHFNNTCDFALDCIVTNDATEQEQHVVLMPKQHSALLVATGVDISSFDAQLDCTWHD
jgi:hypothetical protein